MGRDNDVKSIFDFVEIKVSGCRDQSAFLGGRKTFL